jgi:hypothetical protein
VREPHRNAADNVSYTVSGSITSSNGIQTKPLVRVPLAKGSYAQPAYTMDEVVADRVYDAVKDALAVGVTEAVRVEVVVNVAVTEYVEVDVRDGVCVTLVDTVTVSLGEADTVTVGVVDAAALQTHSTASRKK